MSGTLGKSPLRACIQCALKVALGVGLCCLVYLLLARSPGTSSHLRQRRASLAQATIVSRHLRELSLKHFSSTALQTAFSMAGQLTQSSQQTAAQANSSQNESTESSLLLKKALDILGALSTAKPVVSCKMDSTLLLDTSDSDKVLLAANMHNNEDLLPHFTLQMLDLLSKLPLGSAFLSIYESGSTDSTGVRSRLPAVALRQGLHLYTLYFRQASGCLRLLQTNPVKLCPLGAWLEVLQDLMVCLGVPHRIIIGGSLTRGESQDRIDFLAQARNRALEPLWLPTDSAASASINNGHSHEKAWDLLSTTRSAHVMWQAKKVIFFNDVYFCAQDVLRLLKHNADMVCGMDFDRPTVLGLTQKDQHALFAQYLRRAYKVPAALGRWLGRSGLVTKHWRFNPSTQAAFQAQAVMGFYDTWVARDSDGNLFLKDAPYVTDPYSLERIAKGLPFPVKCCWNGLVALRAEPFSKHNLRVRMHQQGECAASECSLVCNDFQRLGYRSILVDPGVRQAYEVLDAIDLYNNKSVPDLPYISWAEVAGAPAVNWDLVPHRPYSKCCGLPEGHNMIEFDKDCFWDNFMQPNFTAMSSGLHYV